MQPGQLQHLAQILNHLQQPAVIGQFLDGTVEFLVGVEEASLLSLLSAFLEQGVNRLETGDIFWHCAFQRRLESTAAFEHRHQRKDFVEVALGISVT